MTFNLRVRTILDGHNIWDQRRALVVERVRAFDPDLLGTQEGLDSMEAYLSQQLGDYTFRGAGRGDGKLSRRNERRLLQDSPLRACSAADTSGSAPRRRSRAAAAGARSTRAWSRG